MPFKIVRNDITTMQVDAIVNPANVYLKMGGGVCGAIFKRAGARELQDACDSLSPIETGEAVITPGFKLAATYIIHTPGPIYSQWSKEESGALLKACYRNSLKIAVEHGCSTIAFPLISSGIYGYPKDQALLIARSSIQEFLLDHDIDVTLVVFDKSSFVTSQELHRDVESYIDQHYVQEKTDFRRLNSQMETRLLHMEECCAPFVQEEKRDETLSSGLDKALVDLDEPFSALLMRMIDAKGFKDVDVYKKANLDRKLFSKIRNTKNYSPSKKTAIALAIALELSLEETTLFLERAGYALSHAVKFDVIVEYFILHQRYNIYEINEVLFEYDQQLLGS